MYINQILGTRMLLILIGRLARKVGPDRAYRACTSTYFAYPNVQVKDQQNMMVA